MGYKVGDLVRMNKLSYAARGEVGIVTCAGIKSCYVSSLDQKLPLHTFSQDSWHGCFDHKYFDPINEQQLEFGL